MSTSRIGPNSEATIAPVRDVVASDGAFRALSSEPWLKVHPSLRPGRTYEIIYSCGPYQEVVRPLLRFIFPDGSYGEVHMPAACEGLGIWRGRIPARTEEVWISPVKCAGSFSFQLKAMRVMTISDRFPFMAARPKRAFFAAAARLVGLDAEADLNLRWVYGRAESQDFRQWKALRREIVGPPPAAEQRLATIFMRGPEPPRELARSVYSLFEQTHQNWRLCVVSPTPEQAAWIATQNDPRLTTVPNMAVKEGQDGFVAFLAPGDELNIHALACVQAHFERQTAEAIAYCDEIRIAGDGACSPVLKPDWSPVRQAFSPYVGRAAFVRAEVAAWASLPAGQPEEWVSAILSGVDSGSVGHIRRPLLYMRRDMAVTSSSWEAKPQNQAARPAVAIVVPTRDRLDLLQPCLESVLRKTRYASYKIVIVDNDSADARTTRWLQEMQRQERRISVISCPGPFNFSALCNFGAASVESEFLLFLNNDTEVLQADWLGQLLRFGCAADIGAVGAKLLYPGDRVQHAGVVLGLGGVAGHFGEGSTPASEGWLGACQAPHEVSAVTGACLLVSREKFEAVGGFDEINLPVDLNDVDLCLRLAERGWRTICDCQTELLHRQSASRGSGAIRLQKVYAKERSYFIERWRDKIRDDPYFNPTLSLYDLQEALA